MKNNYKRLISLLLVCVILCLSLASCGKGAKTETDAASKTESISVTEEKKDVHRAFGIFETKDMKGNKVDQTIFENKKLTMVVFWATYCTFCIDSMGTNQKISEEYADKGVQVIGIPCDVRGQNKEPLFIIAETILEKSGAEYTNIVPGGESFEKRVDQVISLPDVIFLDENGNQVGESYVGSRDYDTWTAIIDSLLTLVEQ